MVRNEDVFAKSDTDLGKTNVIKHDIRTGDKPPVVQRPRRIAQEQVKDLQEQIYKLRDQGTIRPSNSNWASNVLLVRKKDGSWRLCIDYRELNSKTKNQDPYILPRIDDTLDTLSGAKYFASLDLIQVYHQIELTEAAKPKTAFIAPRCNPSHWEYNYMPFGIQGGPGTFQRLMDLVLQNLEYKIALAYLDDIIVYGKTPKEVIVNCDIVCERLRKAGLKLKPKKCIFFQTETAFLGHIISSEVVSCDPKKLEIVKT